MSRSAESCSAECEVRSAKLKTQKEKPSALSPSVIPHFAFRTSHSRGFTLIEVLLALAILAAVLGVVYASFFNAEESIRRAETVRDDTDLARGLISRLSADIENTYVKGSANVIGFTGAKEEPELDGEKRRLDSLSLTTLTNWRRPGTKESELWEVGYRFQEKTGGDVNRVLLRREKRELTEDVPFAEGGTEYELTDRVRQLRLRYYDGAAWKDDWKWKEKASLPSRVEVLFVLDDGRMYITETALRNR